MDLCQILNKIYVPLFQPAKSVLFTIHFSLFTISRITFFAPKCNFF